ELLDRRVLLARRLRHDLDAGLEQIDRLARRAALPALARGRRRAAALRRRGQRQRRLAAAEQPREHLLERGVDRVERVLEQLAARAVDLVDRALELIHRALEIDLLRREEVEPLA